MKTTILFAAFLFSIQLSFSQDGFKQIYNPEADAKKDISEAVIKAKNENKHVFIIMGFNRCPWCQLFHKFINNDQQVDSLIEANYVKVMVNYDKKDKNKELMKELEYPNRFGFPVFIVLNGEGRRIHTQNSAYLEEGKGYNRKEVMKFFKHWSPAALDDKSYQ